MKLSILDAHALNPGDLSWDIFRPFADITVYENTDENQVVERIKDQDAILLNKVVISEEILKECKNLKYIGVLATGYNVIDINAVRKRNIVVTNIPAYSTMAVAQHTFAFITYFSNQVALHNESVHNGEWITSPAFCYWKSPLMELEGKKLGILGYGNIGKQVEKIAEAFGMKCLVVPHKANSSIKNCVSLEKMLTESDFISLHAPLTDETKEFINKNTISKMKDGVYIINTARGGLVNEKDLKDALDSGKIKGYAADVLLNEPMKKDCLLLKQKNCILTPHIAWASLETRKRALDIAFKNFEGWINGKIINSIY